MISHKHKCIFVHIPKCAGTSFESALGHFDVYEGRGRQDHRTIRAIQQPFNPFDALKSVENAKETIRRFRHSVRKHQNPNNTISVTADQYSSYFKFAVVRNPWDRAFSWYKNVLRDPIHQKNYKIPSDISFYDFLKSFSGTGYLRPQTYWLENYKNTIDLDYIGKFEELDQVFSTIASRFNLKENTFPKETHGSESQTVSNLKIDQQSIDFIRDFYKKEIDLFGYSSPKVS